VSLTSALSRKLLTNLSAGLLTRRTPRLPPVKRIHDDERWVQRVVHLNGPSPSLLPADMSPGRIEREVCEYNSIKLAASTHQEAGALLLGRSTVPTLTEPTGRRKRQNTENTPAPRPTTRSQSKGGQDPAGTQKEPDTLKVEASNQGMGPWFGLSRRCTQQTTREHSQLPCKL
jgi:hypothetical protein